MWPDRVSSGSCSQSDLDHHRVDDDRRLPGHLAVGGAGEVDVLVRVPPVLGVQRRVGEVHLAAGRGERGHPLVQRHRVRGILVLDVLRQSWGAKVAPPSVEMVVLDPHLELADLLLPGDVKPAPRQRQRRGVLRLRGVGRDRRRGGEGLAGIGGAREVDSAARRRAGRPRPSPPGRCRRSARRRGPGHPRPRRACGWRRARRRGRHRGSGRARPG